MFKSSESNGLKFKIGKYMLLHVASQDLILALNEYSA